MMTFLSLLLASVPVAADALPARKPVAVMATATVTIIRIERIEIEPQSGSLQPTDRQFRQRDSVPMVDFY